MDSTTIVDRTTPAIKPTPAKALQAVAVFTGVGVGLCAVYATTGWGIPCPLRMVTGWLCPLCGGTHLGAHLLRADLLSAWNDNAALFISLFLFGVRSLGWGVECVQHVNKKWLPEEFIRYGLPIALCLAFVWMIMRNLM